MTESPSALVETDDRVLPATPENIALARAFAWRKWQERASEIGIAVTDLSSSCKFTSMFAQRVFGGMMQGNFDHQFVRLPDGRVLDLNEDAADVRGLPEPYRHDPAFWGNPDHLASLRSCAKRVEGWVSEFMAGIRPDALVRARIRAPRPGDVFCDECGDDVVIAGVPEEQPELQAGVFVVSDGEREVRVREDARFGGWEEVAPAYSHSR